MINDTVIGSRLLLWSLKLPRLVRALYLRLDLKSPDPMRTYLNLFDLFYVYQYALMYIGFLCIFIASNPENNRPFWMGFGAALLAQYVVWQMYDSLKEHFSLLSYRKNHAADL